MKGHVCLQTNNTTLSVKWRRVYLLHTVYTYHSIYTLLTMQPYTLYAILLQCYVQHVWHCTNNRRQGNWINRAEPHGSHHFIIVQYALDVRLIMSGEDCINKHMI